MLGSPLLVREVLQFSSMKSASFLSKSQRTEERKHGCVTPVYFSGTTMPEIMCNILFTVTIHDLTVFPVTFLPNFPNAINPPNVVFCLFYDFKATIFVLPRYHLYFLTFVIRRHSCLKLLVTIVLNQYAGYTEHFELNICRQKTAYFLQFRSDTALCLCVLEKYIFGLIYRPWLLFLNDESNISFAITYLL